MVCGVVLCFVVCVNVKKKKKYTLHKKQTSALYALVKTGCMSGQ